MLQFYNRLYVKKSPLLNTIWDIAFAIFFTIVVVFNWTELALPIRLLLLILFWVKVILTIICFITFKKEKADE